MNYKFDRHSFSALLVAATMFMDILDGTVITTSLPAMAKDFDCAAAHLSLGVSAYLVALTMFIPAGNWLADRFGARRIFTTAITIFISASILCALSHSLSEFTGARILQGIGGAMMVPVGRMVVLRHTQKSEVVRTIAILTWPALAAPLIGPLLGGWITVNWGWHWIFLLNIPLGIIAILATLILFDNEQQTRKGFDWIGFMLSSTGFGFFMAGIEATSRRELPWLISLSVCVLGIALLVQAARHLKWVERPLFSLWPLQIQTFRLGMVGGTFFRIAFSTVPFLLPLMLQLAMGYSPIEAGALLLWLFAGNLFMKPMTTPVMNWIGFRRLLTVNGMVVMSSLLVLALFTSETPRWLIISILFISGMCRSMQYTAMNSITFADIPQNHMRDASTLQAVMQQMNRGTGIALGALALSLASTFIGSTSAEARIEAFHLAFVMISGLTLLAIFDVRRLAPEAGDNILKKNHNV